MNNILSISILTDHLCAGLTQKSLRRLFPCDTSMVVIIDDRADVWDWCPNLLKVVPCMSLSFLPFVSGLKFV
jgi:TFIIF-interacting CTD phosphatase-like protein